MLQMWTQGKLFASWELNLPILLQCWFRGNLWTSSHSVLANFKVEFESYRKYITVSVNKIWVCFQFDTASEITLISQSMWEHENRPHCLECFCWWNSAIQCHVFEKGFSGICYVKDFGLNLIGLDWIDTLDLFSMSLNTVFTHLLFPQFPRLKTTLHFLSKWSSVMFSWSISGAAPKSKLTLKLNLNVMPVFRPKHPVPYADLDLVEKDFKHFQQARVIQPTNYSAWAAPIVVVKKASSKVCICADFSTGLIDSLDACYPHQKIFSLNLMGGTCFGKIDLSDAFFTNWSRWGYRRNCWRSTPIRVFIPIQLASFWH